MSKKHFYSSLTAPGAMSGDRLWVQCCVATTHSHTALRRPPQGTYLRGAEPRRGRGWPQNRGQGQAWEKGTTSWQRRSSWHCSEWSWSPVGHREQPLPAPHCQTPQRQCHAAQGPAGPLWSQGTWKRGTDVRDPDLPFPPKILAASYNTQDDPNTKELSSLRYSAKGRDCSINECVQYKPII